MLLCACGGEESGGMAGGPPAAPRTIGETCLSSGECRSGTICGSGFFPDQCTTTCSSGVSCQVIQSGAACFGAPNGTCGLACSGDGQCPVGTTCMAVAGVTACKAP